MGKTAFGQPGYGVPVPTLRNTKPSQADINLTKKLVEAGKLLDISVLDHIIITDSESFSFMDEGLL